MGATGEVTSPDARRRPRPAPHRAARTVTPSAGRAICWLCSATVHRGASHDRGGAGGRRAANSEIGRGNEGGTAKYAVGHNPACRAPSAAFHHKGRACMASLQHRSQPAGTPSHMAGRQQRLRRPLELLNSSNLRLFYRLAAQPPQRHLPALAVKAATAREGRRAGSGSAASGQEHSKRGVAAAMRCLRSHGRDERGRHSLRGPHGEDLLVEPVRAAIRERSRHRLARPRARGRGGRVSGGHCHLRPSRGGLLVPLARGLAFPAAVGSAAGGGRPGAPASLPAQQPVSRKRRRHPCKQPSALDGSASCWPEGQSRGRQILHGPNSDDVARQLEACSGPPRGKRGSALARPAPLRPGAAASTGPPSPQTRAAGLAHSTAPARDQCSAQQRTGGLTRGLLSTRSVGSRFPDPRKHARPPPGLPGAAHPFALCARPFWRRVCGWCLPLG